MEIFELVEVLRAMKRYEVKYHSDPVHHCIGSAAIDLQSTLMGLQDLEGKPLLSEILVNFTREAEVRFDFGRSPDGHQ